MPEDRESDPLPPGQARAPHTDARIAALAAAQHGVVSRGQLLAEAIPSTTIEDRVRRGHLIPLHREVVAADALRRALNEAERQRILDVKGIEEALGRVRGRRGPGIAKLRAALSDLAATGTTVTRSWLEDRLLALLAAHDLPRPATNAHVAGYECDAVWHRQRLVVELDGWDAHKTRRAFQQDRTKANALTNAGWAVLRFTHADVARRPHETAAAIRAQLTRAA
jgi:very-short-patch-repair endonuclease